MIIYIAHKKTSHSRICMFTEHGVGEKEANSFIPAYRKKHNKLSTHTPTHIHTQTIRNNKEFY